MSKENNPEFTEKFSYLFVDHLAQIIADVGYNCLFKVDLCKAYRN